MDIDDIRRIAEQTGIAEATIARWHLIEAPRMGHSRAGRPKGKPKRPRGMLSVGDTLKKFNLKPAALVRWREAGMKVRPVGGMLLIRESDVTRFMRRDAEG